MKQQKNTNIEQFVQLKDRRRRTQKRIKMHVELVERCHNHSEMRQNEKVLSLSLMQVCCIQERHRLRPLLVKGPSFRLQRQLMQQMEQRMEQRSAAAHTGVLVTNNNGSSLMHACEASGLILANTFTGGGPTCWTPDGSSSHCIDFIAIPQELRPQIALCRVNQVLGRRWQMSLVRDYWPVEVHVRLPKPWKLLRKRNTTTRWNKHALQVALDDPHVAQAFLEDASRAWAPFVGSAVGIGTAWDLQELWTALGGQLHEVAVRHFGLRPTQKSEKLLPATFDLLRHKRQYQTELLTLAGGWCHQPLRQGTHWFYFQLWSMLCKYLRPASAAKQAVKTDNANWDARLESNLQLAVDMHDSRTAWGFCRLPAPAAELHLRCSSLLRDNGKHTWQRSGEQKSITLQ